MNDILKKLTSRKFLAAVAGTALGAAITAAGLDANIVLSRQLAGVYVCDNCGMDEALRDFARYPLPLEEWSAARMPAGK